MASFDLASIICQALGRGVTRSKQMAMRWARKGAENGDANACLELAGHIYMDYPYACEVGRVGQAAGVATSVGGMEGHDVLTDVLTDVAHWLRNGGHTAVEMLNDLRLMALEGAGTAKTMGVRVWAI